MAVRKRPNGSWLIDIVVWKGGDRIRIRKTTRARSKPEAQEAERKERIKLKASPVLVTSEVPLFAAFAAEFLRTYVAVENKHSEQQTKEAAFRNHLVPAFGKLRLDAIGAMQIDGYKAKKLAEGFSPKSVNNHLTILRRCLSVAAEWGQLAVVPRIRWLKTKKPEFDFLTFDEAARLLAAAEPEWHPMILLALRTGLRRGELLALRWTDVDLVAGKVIVRQAVYDGVIDTPKSARQREVPLSDEVIRVLKGARHLKGEYIFCAPNGRILTKNEVRAPLRRAYTQAGLRAIGWHVLRHTFASHLAMRGVPLKAIQELMGHATIEMTLRYSHMTADVRRDAVRLLDQQPKAASAALA